MGDTLNRPHPAVRGMMMSIPKLHERMEANLLLIVALVQIHSELGVRLLLEVEATACVLLHDIVLGHCGSRKGRVAKEARTAALSTLPRTHATDG